MLGKLMKHDIKKISKILVILYGISLGLAGLTRLINIGKKIQAIAIIGGVFAGLTYSAIGSVLVNTFVHIIRVFTVDFYKDESYLTHTLPIKKGKLLLSKYLSSLFVTFCSVAVCFLSLFTLFYSPKLMLILKLLIAKTVAGYNMPSWLFLTLIVAIIFTQICAIITMSFTAIIKANTYNHKRILKGLLWLALFYFGSMFAVVFVAIVTLAIQGNLSQLVASQMNNVSFISIIVIALLVYVLCAIAFYFLSKKMFEKGVNVD